MKVAVVGLGQMGAEVARRIEGSEHDLVVYNRSPQKAEEFVARGATLARTPAEAMAAADVCVSMLADGPSVVEISSGPDGLFECPDPAGKVLIEMSTIDVESSARVAAAATERGVAYLRAPVSGNPSVVAAGKLAIMVSGAAADFDAAKDLLAAIGPTLYYLGEGEAARVMKLALNLILAGTTELLAEALVMGQANGLKRDEMLEVIGGSALGSPFVHYKTPGLVAEDYGSTFSANLLAKDLDLVLDCAGRASVPVPTAALVSEQIRECIAEGMGELDLSVLVPHLEQRAGLRDSLPST